jgi:NAD(P)H-dependent FMN reductase
MAAKLKIAVLISTIREARFATRPAHWLLDLAERRGGADFEVIDLRDYPLPLFNESVSPAYVPPKNETAQRFGAKMDEFDGYIFVTAEYNHGIPGVLKNALDYVYVQLNRKPVAFVGYGGVGAARAVEQLRLVLIELQAAPLRNAVHVGWAEFSAVWQQGKAFSDFPYLEQMADTMFEDLLWWAKALQAARASSIDDKAQRAER